MNIRNILLRRRMGDIICRCQVAVPFIIFGKPLGDDKAISLDVPLVFISVLLIL